MEEEREKEGERKPRIPKFVRKLYSAYPRILVRVKNKSGKTTLRRFLVTLIR